MTRETVNNSSSTKPSVDSGFPIELEGLVDDNTILVQRTLRSGQSICHDGNVVVMGDVNPGAEIVAAGNIIVMGALRGVVHAGAQGDNDALVLAFRLRPTQLRIANHITRPPEEEESDPDYPEVARIKNDVVTIETFNAQMK
ncbi:septum site-determining protein MinC [Desulforamulus aquiferis]|uniref:Septum site-determining protein MinC n=1 Tax=Desulforamulus aquiferis TaxID=1397668 RepID=A0AAW7ZAW9_9FIRM|nr:septum site-determining protein MinC [Desulforamulus aquiferis]MDO7786254.1 septum site-determining protein MinC [Desulforamulus aquiferis]RYD01768.1 septum site-determining protein MinC [Desulforamulus aquiferis]